MYNICVFTGSRSDYGLIKNTINQLMNYEENNVRIIVSGSHLDESYGNSIDEIIEDGFCNLERIRIPLCSSGKVTLPEAIGVGIQKFSVYFNENKPDVLVVLGDRYEAYAICTAAFTLKIPIAHISGGDVTEGALDDVFRHCITKMSYLHFTGCEQSRQRVIQLGENPVRVFNVGEPGVENILNIEVLDRKELAGDIGWEGINDCYALVTFHPETFDGDDYMALSQLEELIKSIKQNDTIYYLITLSNADAAGDVINERWRNLENELTNIKVVASLGIKRYLSAMKYCSFVLGNSSSGIVEAPSYRVPTVNIGDRQRGRMCAKSVINCQIDCFDINNAINKAMSEDFIYEIKDTISPFGNGETSWKIADVLVSFLKSGKLVNKKKFYDLF